MDNSLERIIPDLAVNDTTERETLYLHVERYHYAGRHLIPGTVADIACGSGYGSYLLATNYSSNISTIYAVDLNPDCIRYASDRYGHSLIQYIHADAFQFSSPLALNNIISLETIEHLPDPNGFVQRMASQLATNGRFIASVPITPSMDANPYHLHDFSPDKFKEMFFRAGFRELDSFIQKQSYNPVSIVDRKGPRTKHIRRNITGFYWKYPRKFILRLQSLLKDGFTNKYLIIVFEKF